MADKTKIEWTDATWNPITGCAVVSPGCTNCYAMRLAGTRMKNHPSRKGLTRDTKAGPVWNGEIRFNEQWLDQPLKWSKSRMIFVCAHADLFADGVKDEWLVQIFAVMAAAPQHTFQVLTKRPERMRDFLTTLMLNHRLAATHCQTTYPLPEDYRFPNLPLPNVWLGVSVEDQKRADARIPVLLDTPAAIRWISAEPLLGPIDLQSAWHGENALYSECWGECAWCEKGHPPLHNCQHALTNSDNALSGLDWVVVGGESGPGARPMHPDWARTIRDQCAEDGVAFHFKQWGAWTPGENVPHTVRGRRPSAHHWPSEQGEWMIGSTNMRDPEDGWDDEPDVYRIGKRAAGRLLDGVAHDAFPQVVA